MSVKLANFHDILAFYFEGTSACVAAKDLIYAINNDHEPWLQRMLQNSPENTLRNNKEILFRKRVDALLGCYSVMEVAITGQLIPNPDPDEEFWKNAFSILDNAHVRYYYTVLHVEPLLRLLHKRLKDKSDIENAPPPPFTLMLT